MNIERYESDREGFLQFVTLICADPEINRISEVFSEAFLWNFFIGRKGNIERAYKTIKGYINHRSRKYPDILTESRVSARLYRDGYIRRLKYMDAEGKPIWLIRSINFTPLEHNPADDWIREMVNFSDAILRSENTAPFETGQVIIVDTRGYTFQQIRPFTPSKIAKAATLFLDLPIRFKAFHLINTGLAMTAMLTIALKFMPEKIQKRVHPHKDSDSLLSFLNQNLLPECIGGTVPESEAYDMEFQDKILELENFYEDWRKRLPC